jgi:hypothetical protein
VAIVTVGGADDSWEGRDSGEDDPAEVAAGTDSGLLDTDALPGHEDDARRATDTATSEQNP